MTDAVMTLAARASCDPHFLAFAFAEYAESEGLDETGLLALLGVTPEGLASARLCRMPRPDPAGFREDVDRIAAKFGLSRDTLAVVARCGQVVAEFRRAAEELPTESAAPLLAARDRPERSRRPCGCSN